jgi:hypothetical protein
VKTHEAWIDSPTDGSRQLLKLCDWTGRIVYVTVHDILDKCPQYAAPQEAYDALWKARETARNDFPQ